ncbi:hypothetical protein ACPA9J_30170 [Pseudomonas aeruginosa]
MVTQLLTADGGEWEVSKHLQEIMALAADGTLYLSESHQNDIHVLSFIDRLDRRGFRYQLNLTDLQTIHQLYRAVAMDGLVDSDGQRATQMQERVVKIIRKATELRASDVHFVVSPAGTGSKIRFRVDGLLKTVEQYRSQELHELCATIYQSMCDVAEPLFAAIGPGRADEPGLRREAEPVRRPDRDPPARRWVPDDPAGCSTTIPASTAWSDSATCPSRTRCSIA